MRQDKPFLIVYIQALALSCAGQTVAYLSRCHGLWGNSTFSKLLLTIRAQVNEQFIVQ